MYIHSVIHNIHKHRYIHAHVHICKTTHVDTYTCVYLQTYIHTPHLQYTHTHTHQCTNVDTSHITLQNTTKDHSIVRYIADKHTCKSTCTHSTTCEHNVPVECTLTVAISKLSSSSRSAWCTLLSTTPHSAGVSSSTR